MANALEGYASLASAAQGDAIDFHVRADDAHARFKMEIYRRGMQDVLLTSVDDDAFVPGAQDDAQLAVEGCNWPAASKCRTVVPEDWRSGYYVAKLSSGGADSWIPFIVRSSAQISKILAKISDTTSQAYNAWGGRGFYTAPFSPRISFDRPYDDLVLYEHYQLPFVRWADHQGYALDFCSSVDLHTNPLLLQGYRLFLSIGHDEYWSLEMRDQVEAFIASGGNACFFSANTCFWQIRFDLDNGKRIQICYKEAEPGHPQDPERADPRRVTTEWSKPPVNRPENSMTGVSYRNGAGWWNDPIDPAKRYRGYTVTDAPHWVFAATGLRNGQTFGAGADVESTILGYETDAALVKPGTSPPQVLGTDGTPKDFAVLAAADLTDWGKGGQAGRATMGLYRRNGSVLTAGTVNWAGGLQPVGSTVERITDTVLQRLSQDRSGAIDTPNSSFQDWQDGVPSGWILDGDGGISQELLSPEVVSNYMRFSARDGIALRVDASAGQTWISASGFSCKPKTLYGAGCWAKSSSAGATIRLQTTTDTWRDFAIAEHTGSGQWEYLFAIGSLDQGAVPFPARVKIQLVQGGHALFDNVAVLEIEEPAP